MFWTSLWTLFGALLDEFWGPFLGPDGRWAKMGSKRPIKSFKVAKTCICKKLKKHYVFRGFWASKAVQDSLGRPKKAPKRRLKSSKGFKKVDPKIEQSLIIFWISFGALLGPILGQNRFQKGTKNGTSFGTTSHRISGVRILRFQELYERCGKAIGIGIILSKEE